MAILRKNETDDNLYYWTNQNSLPKEMAARIKDKEYKYDPEYVDELIQSGDYNTCNRYLECFHFKDPNDEAQFNDYKMRLKSDADKANAYQNNINTIKNKYTKDNVEFAANFLVSNKQLTNNDTYTNYCDIKDQIGSKLNSNGEIIKRADVLDIEFSPSQSKILGIIPVDNDDSYEIFQTRIGMTDKELQEAGITIRTNNNGNKVISFNKDNALSDKIIYTLTHRPDKGFLDEIGDKGYIITGKSYDGEQTYKGTTYSITDEDSKDQNAMMQFAKLYTLFSNAFSDKEDFDENEINGGIKKFEQAVVVGSLTSDNIMNFQEFAQATGMKDNTYLTYTEYFNGEIEKIIGSSINAPEVYADVYQEDNGRRDVNYTNTDLRKVDTNKYSELLDLIHNSNDVTYMAGYMGDQVGLFVTVGYKALSSTDVERTSNKSYANDKERPTYRIFIPGFCTEALNRMAAKDPKLQADKEEQYLKNLNTTYTFVNGESMTYSQAKKSYIYYDPINGVKEQISDKDAKDYIMQDKAIQIFTNNFLGEHGIVRTDGTVERMTDSNGRDLISDNVMRVSADFLKYMYSEEDYDFLYQNIDIDDLYSTDKYGNKSINAFYQGKPIYNKWVNPLNTIGYMHNMIMRNISRLYKENLYPNTSNNKK